MHELLKKIETTAAVIYKSKNYVNIANLIKVALFSSRLRYATASLHDITEINGPSNLPTVVAQSD